MLSQDCMQQETCHAAAHAQASGTSRRMTTLCAAPMASTEAPLASPPKGAASWLRLDPAPLGVGLHLDPPSGFWGSLSGTEKKHEHARALPAYIEPLWGRRLLTKWALRKVCAWTSSFRGCTCTGDM